jgi:hypothetical protein
MSDDFNPDRDWNFQINFEGVSAPTQLGNIEIPEGYYSALVTDMYVSKNNANRIVLKLTVQDSPYNGAVRTDGMNVPKDDQDKVRFYWRALAESAGFTAAQLDKGEIKLSASTFMKKTVHFHFKPKSDTSQYENISYFSKSIWEQQKANFKPAVAKAATAAPSQAPLGGGDTTTPNDVLRGLGVSL